MNPDAANTVATGQRRAGQGAVSAAPWPGGDLEARLARALNFANVVLSDFGDTGYVDPVRPMLSFGPEKVVGEAALLAYAASMFVDSPAIGSRLNLLISNLEPLVRSRGALADMALTSDRVYARAVPHVLLTRTGHGDAAFDEFAWERCLRALDHAVDQPATVLAERDWVIGVWGRTAPAWIPAGIGSPLERPIDHVVASRDDAYSLTHLLFYTTDFGRRRPRVARPLPELLADVEALLIRYLEHGDFDLVGELLMAWPQFHVPWSPTAAFAFRVLTSAEDEVGVLPCGNLDSERLAALDGEAQTKYARAVSYHTAMVMGLLCAVSLPPDARPPLAIPANGGAESAWRPLMDLLPVENAYWRTVFENCTDAEKRSLAPMLSDMAISRALRERDFPRVVEILEEASHRQISGRPLHESASNLIAALNTASRLGA